MKGTQTQTMCAIIVFSHNFISESSSCWTHKAGKCVFGSNIIKYNDKSVDVCKTLCLKEPRCVAFEYGVPYGGSGNYKARDCQLQSKQDVGTCNGKEYNLDLYVKTGCNAGKFLIVRDSLPLLYVKTGCNAGKFLIVRDSLPLLYVKK